VCGIAGVVALNGSDPVPGCAVIMRDAILSRGPDGVGDYDAPGVSLAACRLAIVDLEPRGLMPMSTPDGRFHIVHNGEIYNRLELRDELMARGVELHTTTDTEVIVLLYALDGPQMLDRLDGMFAFAIWDADKRELFAARDRVGEKPFHYAKYEGRLYFASEPKALFAAGVPCEYDPATWLELLTFRSTAGARTPYLGVERLLPGYWLRASRGGVETKQWWDFPISGAAPNKGVFKSLLETSVRRRLIADVPVGTLLSGGLDSSSVTALASEMSDHPVPAFTVRYDGTRMDEGVYASAAAKKAGVEHHEIRVPYGELPQLLTDTTRHMDEPIAFQASPDQLAVSRYARQYVRVLLTGESADELFGGYGRMRLLRYPRVMSTVGRALGPVRGRLRYGSRWQRMESASRIGRAEFIAASYADGDSTRHTHAPLAEWAPYRAEMAAAAVRNHREPVRQAMAYERLTHLPAVLTTGDRMTMGAAIEARMPFTDPRLLEFAGLARTADLFSGPHGKQPIREAMADRLPDSVINRRKQGWSSPYSIYLRKEPKLRAWLTAVPDHEIVAKSETGTSKAREIIDGFLSGDDRQERDAWMIGRIVLWHQVCVEGQVDPFATRTE